MQADKLIKKTNKDTKSYINKLTDETEKKLGSLETAFSSMKKNVSKKSDVVMKKASGRKKQAEKMIASSPFKSLAIATAFGAAVGFLSKRKKVVDANNKPASDKK